jgi:hypothetical protein
MGLFTYPVTKILDGTCGLLRIGYSLLLRQSLLVGNKPLKEAKRRFKIWIDALYLTLFYFPRHCFGLKLGYVPGTAPQQQHQQKQINTGNMCKQVMGNRVVYVAQTVHRFAHHAKCVQRCQTYLFVSNKRKFTIKIT